jgi:hypothetical protein
MIVIEHSLLFFADATQLGGHSGIKTRDARLLFRIRRKESSFWAAD